jgi:hypothetical protein
MEDEQVEEATTQSAPLTEPREAQARKALELMNLLMTDEQEGATLEEKRCSYALYEACFTWLRCCNVPFIMDKQSELYRFKRPEEL